MSDGLSVKHLVDNLYLVPRNLIVFSDNPADDFINPRHTVVSGHPDAKGLDPQSLKKLKTSIQKDGLFHAPILHGASNIGNSLLKVNSGERRVRCIDMLVRENSSCFDPVSRKIIPASQLYACLRCEINVSTDLKEQYRIAFSTNGEAEGIGETADILLVKRLIDKGFKDEEILDVTNMSSTWLRESYSLIALDADTFNSFCNGSINRKVAIRLAEIKDQEKRKITLSQLRQSAAARSQMLNDSVNKSLDQAIEERALAEAAAADAEEEGDEKRKALSEKKAQRAVSKLNRKAERLKEIGGKKVTATKKDLDSIFQGDDGKKLTLIKAQKHWLPVLDVLIANDGKDEKGVQVCDKNDAILLKMSITIGWNRSEYDVRVILAEYYASKQKKHKGNC